MNYTDKTPQAHSQCSESFYKKELELQIQSEPSKTPQERLKMMEMLKKFEEENQEGTGLDSEPEQSDEEDLAHRFEGLDLGMSGVALQGSDSYTLAEATSTADIWSKLTPAEQNHFLEVMGDPNSDRAKQLLASEELENERCEPWWEAPPLNTSSRRYGTRPDIIPVPAAMVNPIPTGPPLYYNVVAVCIAYSFVTRHLSVSPLSALTSDNIDFEVAKRLISQLVPFLVHRKSQTLHPDLSSLVTDVWSRFEQGQVSSELFAILLQDAAHLIRPLNVTLIPSAPSQSKEYYDTTSHPHLNIVAALSDLTVLYERSITGKPKTGVAHKLLFYAAHILSTPPHILRTLSKELAERSLFFQARASDDLSMQRGSEGQHNRTKGQGPVIVGMNTVSLDGFG
ncbi:hypothetical protein H0H93_010192 [Arthromyces matolae]|nr:hypothetical protein H0H93_010192 [Arthromyces matolae]